MYLFKYHKKAQRGFGYEELTNERVTFMSFDTWQTLHNADPDNWFLFTYEGIEPYWIPAYRISSKRSCGWQYRYIKFLHARDYHKFRRYVKRRLKNGEDVENTKELIELTEIVRERANERLKKAQEETAKALEEAKHQYQIHSVEQRPTTLPHYFTH